MKIIKAWTHKETGIGTYTIVGLGDDNNIYEWKTSKTRVSVNGGEWKGKTPPYWKLRD